MSIHACIDFKTTNELVTHSTQENDDRRHMGHHKDLVALCPPDRCREEDKHVGTDETKKTITGDGGGKVGVERAGDGPTVDYECSGRNGKGQ